MEQLVYLLRYVFGATGFIAGVLFWVEAWRSTNASRAENPGQIKIYNTPRVRGIIYFLGGSFLSATLGNLITDEIRLEAGLYYAAGFVSAALLGLVGFSCYGTYLAYNQLRDGNPDARRTLVFGWALDYAAILIHDGIVEFRKRLREDYHRAVFEEAKRKIEEVHEKAREEETRLKRQKDSAEIHLKSLIDFSLAFVNDLASEVDETPDEARVSSFFAFLEGKLTDYLKIFVEENAILQNFRSSLYFYDDEVEVLRFTIGAAPMRAPHSGNPLPLDSLAGYAIRHPDEAHLEGEPGRTFVERERDSLYSSVISCAVCYPDRNSSPFLVLNIDCVEEQPAEAIPILKSRIQDLAYLFAAAQVAMSITPHDVRGWL